MLVMEGRRKRMTEGEKIVSARWAGEDFKKKDKRRMEELKVGGIRK